MRRDRLADINRYCVKEFRAHWECLENNNHKLFECRAQEKPYNKCVFNNLVSFGESVAVGVLWSGLSVKVTLTRCRRNLRRLFLILLKERLRCILSIKRRKYGCTLKVGMSGNCIRQPTIRRPSYRKEWDGIVYTIGNIKDIIDLRAVRTHQQFDFTNLFILNQVNY